MGAEFEERELGGTGHRVSVVGLDLGAVSSGSAPPRPHMPLAWARAFARGVNLADVAFPGAAGIESLLGSALGSSTGRSHALVALDEGRAGPPEGENAVRERIGRSLRESRARLGDRAVVFPTVLPSQRAWLDRPEVIQELSGSVASGVIGGWGVVVGPRTRSDRLGPVIAAGASFVVVAGHLLDHSALEGAARGLDGTRASLLIRDPHAGGLLDGSFVRGGATAGGPRPRFERWEELEPRLRPVTRLGFLTADRRRTLAEAAVQFLVGLPSVAAVLVRPDDPEVLDAAFRGTSLGPMAPGELRRIEAEVGPAAGARSATVPTERKGEE